MHLIALVYVRRTIEVMGIFCSFATQGSWGVFLEGFHWMLIFWG